MARQGQSFFIFWQVGDQHRSSANW